MATIEQNLQTLVTAKGDIATAITSKGGTVGENDGFTSFADDIASIPAGLADVDYTTRSLTITSPGSQNPETVFTCDATPTSQSNNPVTSGGVYSTTGDINTILDYILSGTTLITKSISSNGTYDASDDSADGYSAVTVDVPNSYTQADEGKVVSDGALVSQTSATYTSNNTYDTTLIDTVTVRVDDGTLVPKQHLPKTSLNARASYNSVWTNKNWTGLSNFYGAGIWTDGDNVYYSNGANQYVLNKSTSTWTTKSWSGVENLTAQYIWTDGTDIYYSNNSSQYVLNKENSTWSQKIWTGLTQFSGRDIWTDGTNIYSSTAMLQYVLNKETSTWTEKSWSGTSDINGYQVWTDGSQIFYTTGGSSWVLNESTSTWTTMSSWSGLTPDAKYIWTDGDTMYYSTGSIQYLLNKGTYTWTQKTWSGISSPDGQYFWTDGDNIYYSDGSTQKVLSKGQPIYTTLSCRPKFTT